MHLIDAGIYKDTKKQVREKNNHKLLKTVQEMLETNKEILKYGGLYGVIRFGSRGKSEASRML